MSTVRDDEDIILSIVENEDSDIMIKVSEFGVPEMQECCIRIIQEFYVEDVFVACLSSENCMIK